MKVTLIMAMTADGKIARHSAHYPDWTGREDKRMFKRLTLEAGVVIMGSRTYETIGRPLPGRLNVVMTRRPERFQKAPNLRLTADLPETILTQLAAQGHHTAALTGGATINALFARARLIDEMIITIIPKVFGQGLSMFSEPVVQDLELLDTHILEPGVLVLHYKLHYGAVQEGATGAI